jgi:hypothetical protein
MKSLRRDVHLAGHWVSLRDAVFIVTVLGSLLLPVVAGIVNLIWTDKTPTTTILLSSILAMLAALSLYVVDVALIGEDHQEALRRDIGSLGRIGPPQDIFVRGIAVLEKAKKQGQWKKVRLYAPVGLWDNSDNKTRWLTCLAGALRSGDVVEFSAVFGLPPDKLTYDSVARPRLALFRDTPRTEIHFLPPTETDLPVAAPGFGLVIFEHERPKYSEVLLGFVPFDTGIIADTGITVRSKDVAKILMHWYDSQVFHGSDRYVVLRGAMSPPRGAVGWDEGQQAIEAWYMWSEGRSGPLPLVALTPAASASASS